ncbi:hypothetical protein TSOC_002295 [Tetrabaena socialis]|uniref:Uncharacterized protein n=1 Tax=Tetrabaena socialis TaxID=47790 RepID=A0A2J8AEE7_9CHLO|nr:hypothetical protein TSOC_002295 [Tetrabaena socialis]|eukprot:PNH10898.1 hypothetical protein TSOC_002295 [Tetrabaena socialis]
MDTKGSFSYHDDNVHWIDANTTAKVERVSNSIARVYLVDNANVQIPVPNNMKMTDQGGNICPPFMNNFMVCWMDTYTLSLNGQVVLGLSNQKHQSLSAPPDAAHGVT